jgi:hypothetical protein
MKAKVDKSMFSCPAVARVSFRTGVVEDGKRAHRRRGSKEYRRQLRRVLSERD